MNIKIIHGDEYDDKDISDMTALMIDQDAGENYSVIDWQNKPHCLLYVLLKSSRFNKNNGGIVLLYDSGILCCISGYNKSHFDDDVYVLGTRTLLSKTHQHKLLMSNIIIPTQMDQVKNKAKMVMFLFDTNNEFNLYTVFISGKLNQFLKNKLKTFDSLWENLNAHEFPVSIYSNTIQNALYIKIDESFDFNWSTIETPRESV